MKPSEESLQTAAQCWCDDETASIVMDERLALAFAKRLDEVKTKLLDTEAKLKDAIEAAWKIEGYAKHSYGCESKVLEYCTCGLFEARKTLKRIRNENQGE